MQLSATSRSLYARRVTRKGWTNTAPGKICISLYSRSFSFFPYDPRSQDCARSSRWIPVYHDFFHAAHTLRRNCSFLPTSSRPFNFGSFNRLKTIYKIRRNTWFFLGNDKESLNVYFPSTSSFTGTVRLFTLPFTARFEISTHTVQLELAFLLCDLTPRTLRFETRAHVHTGEVKGRVVT